MAVLEKLLKLYVMSMQADVRSPVPHLFGPPGCGKSESAEQLAELLGVTLHTINVSRISPLELEGVQMPDKDHSKLNLLTATYWSQLKDGDIVLLDEFLRGFPEVYNGLLDIMTSRRVAGFQLPKVFFLAASNSTVAYDKALEDRLMHLPVKDPRNNRSGRMNLARLLVDRLGLNPGVLDSPEMHDLLASEVLPMYNILDQLNGTALNAGDTTSGTSIRNLIGQVQLRMPQSPSLKRLLDSNNMTAWTRKMYQYLVLYKATPEQAREYEQVVGRLLAANLTDVQRLNVNLNLQVVSLEKSKTPKEEEEVSDGELFDL